MAKETVVKKTAEEITREKLESLRGRERELQVELFTVQKQIEALEGVLRESN